MNGVYVFFYIFHGRHRCHYRRREQPPPVRFLCQEARPGRSLRLYILRPQVCAVVKRSPRVLLTSASRGAVTVSSASLYLHSMSYHRSSNFSLYARPHSPPCSIYSFLGCTRHLSSQCCCRPRYSVQHFIIPGPSDGRAVFTHASRSASSQRALR